MYFCFYEILYTKSHERIMESIACTDGLYKRKEITMKYVKEIMWIIAFTFLGELLNTLLPLPVPSGVYGMILLLIALVTGIVKLPEVEGAGNFLLDTMTMMFIPAAVGIMSAIDILLPVLLPYLVIIVVSTVLVMVVTGLTATSILRRSESKEDQEAEAAELSLEPHETFGLGRRALSPNGEIDGANGYREILREKEVRSRAPQAEANASGAAPMASAEANRKEEA